MALDIERKVGETFEFNGNTFVVSEAIYECMGCFFDCFDCMSNEYNDLGRCCDRQDGKKVIFKESKQQ